MDIGILAVLTGIYKLAEKTGVLEFVKSFGEKTFDALYEKLVQDTVFDGLVKKFFKHDVAKKFAAALDKIAPQNETIKRKFLLSLLIDPTINESIDQMKKGRLPQRQILVPIFQKFITQERVTEAVDRFVETLYDALKKDQEFVNLVIFAMYELLGIQHQELMAKLETEIRANLVTDEPFKISLAKLPTTHHALFGREKELAQLDDAWANSHCHALCFVAFGGVGKTALVNEWLNCMDLDHWRGAERVYGWSFYSQGTREDKQASADTFFEDALAFFGYTGEPITSPWDKGVLLASLIKQRKTLLILDGLEPLQYPPGEMEGRLRDKGMEALLKELARFNNGLAVITTRCRVADIEHTVGKTAHCVELENLSPEAGRQVLRETGVSQGTDQELQDAAAEYGCHALALTLLGTYLTTVHGGEIRKRDLIPQLTEEMEHGGHARRVMESYETWLKGTAELEILYLMGLFDRPAPIGAIDALIKKEPIQGLTNTLHDISEMNWRYAVKHLRDLRLLSASDADKLDCHPLIREHFGQKLKAKGEKPWQEAHSRLYDYYNNLPKKQLPDTLEEMEPLFAAVAHGCQAGRYNEAFEDVYWEKISRKEKFFIKYTLGAYGADLSTMSCFFEHLFEILISELTDVVKSFVLGNTGFILKAMGRLSEAKKLMKADLDNLIRQEVWLSAAESSSNISEIYLQLGNIPQALNYARQSVDFAYRTNVTHEQKLDLTTLASMLFQSGDLIEAEKIFYNAEEIQISLEKDNNYLYSLQGFDFCDLLLSKGEHQEVKIRSTKTIDIAKKREHLLSISLDMLSLGRAHLLQAQFKGTHDYIVAADYLNQAVNGLREAGRQDHLPCALFARAFCYRVQNQFPQAWDDLEEAREIAERGEMKLWLVDYHLEASRLLISEFGFRNVDHQHASTTIGKHTTVETIHELSLRGETSPRHETSPQRAHDHLKQAAVLVQKTGYHRRDPEVELGYAGLFFAQGDQVKAREHLSGAKKMLDKMGIRCWDFEVRRLEQVIG